MNVFFRRDYHKSRSRLRGDILILKGLEGATWFLRRD